MSNLELTDLDHLVINALRDWVHTTSKEPAYDIVAAWTGLDRAKVADIGRTYQSLWLP
jgi:hypothetical protein